MTIAADSMQRATDWYDSVWLKKYWAAKELISRMAPERLANFVETFQILRTDPRFRVRDVPGLFDAVAIADITEVARSIPFSEMELHEMKSFGRFVVHNHPHFTKLQHGLVARVSDLVGEAVEPSYNFLSLYTKAGICAPHLDAPSAKWTLDVCIDQSEPWPIYFSQIVPWPEDRPSPDGDWQRDIKQAAELKFEAKYLTPGNGIVFSGSSQWHYRDAMPQAAARSFCDLLFFHFIPAGAAEIVDTRNWPRLFNLPELADIPGMDEQS